MNDVDRVLAWMDANGHTISSLSNAVGMSYDGLYQVLNVRKRVSPGFMLRFARAFGWEEAQRLFADAPSAVPDSTPA